MTYISGDGCLLQNEPWSIRKVFGFFTNLIFGIVMFFYTLINPGTTKYGNGYTRNYRPGSGPPRPPSKKLGRLDLKPSMNMPGGCSSCARQ
ncbi:selenoprotein K [Chelonus insularis]|uniref:selenoprotein K n=1 Tax=Chelonus insularis TaxID=460826 RepID=UPI00158C6F95|nr:selenoprotein K [Chelonus insularis]